MALGSFLVLFAQESKINTHDNKAYQDALALYNNGQYQAAQNIFQRVRARTGDAETEANAAYYSANAAIRLNQRGADKLMEDFVEGYPTSTKRNSAFLDVADYYFETGKYPLAVKWYKKVDNSTMPLAQRDRYNFNMGYALYASKRPTEAESYLNKVTTSERYGSQAKYYLGYIAYEQDDYNEASARFDQITDPGLLDEKLSYYQADLNFKLGNFEKAIEVAKEELPRANRGEISELNKIIGESYFNLGRYREAIPHLEQYKGKRGRFSNTDYYLLGYSHYKLGDYQSAIQQFNKIIGGDNAVAQNAYYHLAECYLKLDRKPEALNAFRNASQMEFSAEIQKDALLNYARLGYDIGNAYEPVPAVLMSYLEKYPKDAHHKEVQELLVDSYLTSRNFQGAMALLEKNRNYASAATYQRVAYYLGMERLMADDREGALEAFAKSLKNVEDKEFEARARYWKGETAYALDRFAEAEEDFRKFQGLSAAKSLAEYRTLDYNLGYCHFKQRQYDRAIGHFQNAVDSPELDPQRRTDAYLRLGDSHFVTRDYPSAIRSYGEASRMNGPERDYAAFQIALSNGFLGKNEAKIAGLNTFLERYPGSSLRDDALYELGNTYINDHRENLGMETYDRLVGEYPKSRFAPQGILRQGLVHYNASRNQQALDKLKEVVDKYPDTQEAKQAVATAKLIYMDEGRVGEYATWARNLDFVEVTDAELDDAAFESAVRKQVEGKTAIAIRGYEDYLNQFPMGMHALEANFALAQLYFGQGDKERALPKYLVVADAGQGEYTEQALARVCEIYVEKQDFHAARPYLERLEASADIAQNRTFAQSNLMKGHYGQKDYARTIAYAEKVLAAPKIDDRIRSDAKVMVARSAMAMGNGALAQTAYGELRDIASGALAAEAWYHDAYFKHGEGNYEASNESVQKLARDYASHKQWAGKGLLIMAKNFDRLGDAFQATYILESVIANFPDQEDLVGDAKAELARIKAKEAESNSSIDSQNN